MFIKKELIGTKTTCKFCNKEFEIKTSIIFCKDCQHLDKSSYYKKNPDYTIIHVLANKKYRKKHKKDWILCRNNAKKKYNRETLLTASNNGLRWQDWEIQYIEDYSKTKTVRQLAQDLKRTYNSILQKCFILKIKLMTYDKKHGILTTK